MWAGSLEGWVSDAGECAMSPNKSGVGVVGVKRGDVEGVVCKWMR